MNNFFILFFSFWLLSQLIEFTLNSLNKKNILTHQNEVPDFYKERISPETYKKSVAYSLTKLAFGNKVMVFDALITWILILSGFFGAFDPFIGKIVADNTLTHSVAYCLGVGLVLMLVKIPISLYSTFVIEEKFGFNKMELSLFIKDTFKGLLMGFILGTPILYALFWFYRETGSSWWVWGFVAMVAFELFITAVYPVLLAPIFNKFTPLPDGELKTALLTLAKKINFKLSGIFTIDGSKRSSHSNAYFAGIGRWRRIVLFDTLEKQLTQKEIIAVLAHEMGHNIKKHVQKNLIISIVSSFIGFYVLAHLMNWQPFYEAFRAGNPSPHKALILFALFSGTFTFWLTPLMNALSRKHEFEADKFSVETTGDKENMASSLMKLSSDNLSNLTPHPWYSFYHYSHPTTEERVAAIKKIG